MGCPLRSPFSGHCLEDNTRAIYHQGSDKLVVANGAVIGARRDDAGIFLVDTILQPPPDVVASFRVELTRWVSRIIDPLPFPCTVAMCAA